MSQQDFPPPQSQPSPGLEGRMQMQPRERSGPSCWLIGCLISLVLLIILVVLGVVVAMSFNNMANAFIDNFTDTEPVEIPKSELPEEQVQALLDEVKQFQSNAKAGEPTAPLTLTGQELNAIIQNHPDAKAAKDHVYLTIEDDKLHGEVSLPLDMLAEVPFIGKRLAGRYLNCTATFDVYIRNGVVHVYITDGSLRGQPIPDEILSELKKENLMQDVQQDPDLQEALEQIESLEISGGTLTIVPKNTL